MSIVRFAARLSALALLAPCLALAAPLEVAPEDVMAALSGPDKPVIVDVRSVDEYRAAHIPGAINIPHDTIAERFGEIAEHASDGRLVLYCRSGRRVGIAAEFLESHGFSRLNHLTGDFDGWQAAGGAIER